MRSLKIPFGKRNVLAVFAAGTALDTLFTYVALKSFPEHLEEENCLLAGLIGSTGLEWALIVWLAVNIAVLPPVNRFWERCFIIRWLVYGATIGRIIAVFHNLYVLLTL